MIKHCWYVKRKQTLLVIFNDDVMYQYMNVPSKLYASLKSASSVGTFFHWTIKAHPETYPFKKIPASLAEKLKTGLLREA